MKIFTILIMAFTVILLISPPQFAQPVNKNINYASYGSLKNSNQELLNLGDNILLESK